MKTWYPNPYGRLHIPRITIYKRLFSISGEITGVLQKRRSIFIAGSGGERIEATKQRTELHQRIPCQPDGRRASSPRGGTCKPSLTKNNGQFLWARLSEIIQTCACLRASEFPHLSPPCTRNLLALSCFRLFPSTLFFVCCLSPSIHTHARLFSSHTMHFFAQTRRMSDERQPRPKPPPAPRALASCLASAQTRPPFESLGAGDVLPKAVSCCSSFSEGGWRRVRLPGRRDAKRKLINELRESSRGL